MARAWVEHGAPTRLRLFLGWLAGAGAVAAMVVGAWALAEAWRPRLPDPVAIHWGVGGEPDGFASLDGVVRTCTVLGAAGVAALGAVGLATRRRPAYLRGWMTGLAPLVALAPASLLLTVVPNLDAPSGAEARSIGPDFLLVVLLPGVAAASAWFGAAAPARRLAVGPVVPRGAPVSSGRTAYTEWVAMRHLAWIVLAVVTGTALLSVLLGGWALVFSLALGVLLVWFSVYRYRVDDRGLHLGFGPTGPLRRAVAVTEIEAAEVVEVRPRSWGGWGYRINGSHAAVVTRRGPGARLRLAGERSLTLSSDHAERLAGRVNAAVLRHWADRPGGPGNT